MRYELRPPGIVPYSKPRELRQYWCKWSLSLSPSLALSSSRVGFQASHYLSKNLSTLNTDDGDGNDGGGGPSFKFLHSPLLPNIDHYMHKMLKSECFLKRQTGIYRAIQFHLKHSVRVIDHEEVRSAKFLRKHGRCGRRGRGKISNRHAIRILLLLW